jgi:hypothetical protein
MEVSQSFTARSSARPPRGAISSLTGEARSFVGSGFEAFWVSNRLIYSWRVKDLRQMFQPSALDSCFQWPLHFLRLRASASFGGPRPSPR